MKKKTIVTSAFVTILGLGALGSSTALAQTATTQNPEHSLVQRLATKFGLNQTDVQAVFDADREARHAQMKANFEKQLSQYVTDGKITEAQKQLILNKRAELDAAREADHTSNANLTPDERKSQMQAKRTALEAWAKDNGIDMQYLMPRGRHGHGFHGGRSGEQPADSAQATATPTTTQ